MLETLLNFGKILVSQGIAWLERKVQQWTKPRAGSSMLETADDLVRNKSDFVLENALLRQQVIILECSVKHSKMSNTERRLLIKPETVLQWHRDLFKLVWCHKSAAKVGRPRLSPDVITSSSRWREKTRSGERSVSEVNY